MSGFKAAALDSTAIIALAKDWAIRQLLYIPKHPYGGDYPRNSAVKVYAYGSIAKGLAPYLRREKALGLLHFILAETKLADKKYSPDDEHSFLGWSLVQRVLGDLVDAYLKIEAYDEALQAANVITNEDQKVEAIAMIATRLFQEKHFDTAQAFFIKAEFAARDIENIYIRDIGMAALLPFALQLKGSNYVAELAGEIKSQGIASNAYFHTTIQQLIQAKHLAEAEKVARYLTNKVERAEALSEIAAATQSQAIIHELEEYVASATEAQEQLYLLAFLGVALFKSGNLSQSNEVFSRASEIAKEFPPRFIPSPLISFPIALATCGRYDWARAEALAISLEGISHEALSRLTAFLVSQAQFDEAQKTVILQGEYGQVRWLLRLMKTLLAAGYPEKAKALLNQVLVLLSEIDFTSIQPFDHYLATQLLVYFRQIDEAFQYLDKAGIDEYIQALSNATSDFERSHEGLAVGVIKAVIEIAVQKHSDYAPILDLIQ